MNEDEELPLTLSHEDLYALAWSKPMRELAKDFGISDVGSNKSLPAGGDTSPGTWSVGSGGRRLL